MRRITLTLAMALVLTGMAPCGHAEVADAAPGGFTSVHRLTVAATPMEVWDALTRDFGQWWDPAHSFFGDPGKFRVPTAVGGAWMEDAGDGRWVRHMDVVYVDPGKVLRMRGALGPLQAMAVTGALTFTMEPAATGTLITLTYAVGGYTPEGLDTLASVVDGVLGDQMLRLEAYLEK